MRATWSDVTVGPYDPFDGVWLRMTSTEPSTCRLAAAPAAVETGLCTPAIPSRSPALAEAGSLAYFTLRRLDESGKDARFELGAIGHGPDGEHLAERLCEQIRRWNEARDSRPHITAYEATKGESQSTGPIIHKLHSHLAIRS